MDGLRYGLPALVHEVSARGYEPFLDRSLFVYDSPASFRVSLDRMLSANPDRSMTLETYSSCFSFHSGVSRMKHFLLSL